MKTQRSNSTNRVAQFAVAASVLASGVALGSPASAGTTWSFAQACTLSVPGGATKTFTTDVAASYADAGTVNAGTIPVWNENVQIRIPADVYSALAPFATKTSGTASEYYSVGGKASSKPFALTVPMSYTPAGGQFMVSASGGVTSVAVDPAQKAPVSLAHTGTKVSWTTSTGTATLSCGTIPAKPKDTFAVIGDVPYGDAQIKVFPQWIDQINADPDVTLAQHLGDIKNGSSRCDDSYFSMIKSQFNRFTDPLVYSPGDNEWTDCHRANNGAYNPLERLSAVRKTFFATPGVTNGKAQSISTVNPAVPEVVTWNKAGVSYAALHVVGSNDDLLAWEGIGQKTATAEQVAEQKARVGVNLDAIRAAFADAKKNNSRAVSISMQADMFDPTYDVPWANNSAFKPVVEELIKQSNAFNGPVYLFNGDSHVYNSDKPLASGSKWLSFYGVTGSANNLTRVTVDGSSNNKDWLKVSVVDSPEVLTWERVPYTVQAGK